MSDELARITRVSEAIWDAACRASLPSDNLAIGLLSILNVLDRLIHTQVDEARIRADLPDLLAHVFRERDKDREKHGVE